MNKSAVLQSATASAPGKLFIAGEFAVVHPGEPAVLVALDRCLTVRLRPRARAGVAITSALYAHPRDWRYGEAPRDYLSAALTVIETFRADRGLPSAGYDLAISSDLDSGDRKLGLGSSGAVTVAAIDAVARAYSLGLEPLTRFRLALLATIAISPRGSGGDLAASTFGGWLRYTSPDRTVLADSVARRGISQTIMDDAAWAGCTISPLPAPPLDLLVGWTGEPASTDAQVARSRRVTPSEMFLTNSRDAVTAIIEALERGQQNELLEAIARARAVLAAFADATGVTIETRKLAALAHVAQAHGGAGKSSGAGGGDCGIAFAPSEEAARSILKEWAANGITPLPLNVFHHEGDAL